MVNNWDRRVYLYFYASFINAGLQNVIPQVFFSEHYPQQEALLLSLCLLVGAASSISTMGLIRSDWASNVLIQQPMVRAQVGAIVVCLASLWLWQSAALYILSFMMVRALVQVLFNRVDHHYVALTPDQDMATFARHSTVFRLIGVMAGPFCFAILYPHIGVNIGVLLAMTALLMWSFSGMFRERQNDPRVKSTPTKTEKAKAVLPSRQSAFFVMYMLSATTGVYVFSSNAFMIVRDVYGVSSAAAKSGTLLLLMNATGIATVAVWPVLCRKLRRFFPKFPVYHGQSTYALLFLVCVILLKWPLAVSYTYLLVLSMFTGAVYGLFWMKTREFAIHDPEGTREGWMLTLYNNANNFSILFSSLILLVVASISAQWGGSYLNMITTALIVCFAVSSWFALKLDHHSTKTKEEFVFNDY